MSDEQLAGLRTTWNSFAHEVAVAVAAGYSPQRIGAITGLSAKKINAIASGETVTGSADSENVARVARILEQARRFSTYGTIAEALGRTPQAARAVGRSLAASSAVTDSQGAMVLQMDWFRAQKGGFLVPKKEPGWVGRGMKRVKALATIGIDLDETEFRGKKYWFVPFSSVIIDKDELRKLIAESAE